MKESFISYKAGYSYSENITNKIHYIRYIYRINFLKHGLYIYKENNIIIQKGYYNMSMEYGHYQGQKFSINGITMKNTFFHYYL